MQPQPLSLPSLLIMRRVYLIERALCALDAHARPREAGKRPAQRHVPPQSAAPRPSAFEATYAALRRDAAMFAPMMRMPLRRGVYAARRRDEPRGA